MPTRQMKDRDPKIRPKLNLVLQVAQEHIAYLSSDTPCVRIVQAGEDAWSCVPTSTNRGFIVFLRGLREGKFEVRLTEVRNSVAFAEPV